MSGAEGDAVPLPPLVALASALAKRLERDNPAVVARITQRPGPGPVRGTDIENDVDRFLAEQKRTSKMRGVARRVPDQLETETAEQLSGDFHHRAYPTRASVPACTVEEDTQPL